MYVQVQVQEQVQTFCAVLELWTKGASALDLKVYLSALVINQSFTGSKIICLMVLPLLLTTHQFSYVQLLKNLKNVN